MSSYQACMNKAAFCLLLLSGCAHQLANAQKAEEDLIEKSVQESAVNFPAAPRPENLVEFHRSESQVFSVDLASISITPEKTIRYTLIATSQSGVKNISYEGINCETYERKLFGFGQKDGSWRSAKNPAWQLVSQHDNHKQHATLIKDFVCSGKTLAGDTKQIIHLFKHPTKVVNF